MTHVKLSCGFEADIDENAADDMEFLDALELMDLHKITTLAVMDGDEIVGILSIHHIFDFRNDKL